MMKKHTVLTIALTAIITAFLVGGGTIIADNVWQGHDNIVATKVNIDKLSAKIAAEKADLATAKQALKDAQTKADADAKTIADLQTTAQTTDAQLKQKDAEIQQKIADGNAAVAAKQAEVDAKQKTVDDLTAKLQATKADSDQLAQAIKDAQDVKDYSDAAVKEADDD